MKYLVKANLKPSVKSELLAKIEQGSLGLGSVAFGEYVKNMRSARLLDDGTVCWIEVCFCAAPLAEEMPYWQEFFDNISVQNAQDPKYCLDSNGDDERACLQCSCTQELEEQMSGWGRPFLS